MAWQITFHTRFCKVECSRLHSGFGNYSLPTCFNCLAEQGRKDAYAYLLCNQQVWCGWRGAWATFISIHLFYKVLCLLIQYACPIALPLISGLKPFKPLDELNSKVV